MSQEKGHKLERLNLRTKRAVCGTDDLQITGHKAPPAHFLPIHATVHSNRRVAAVSLAPRWGRCSRGACGTPPSSQGEGGEKRT